MNLSRWIGWPLLIAGAAVSVHLPIASAAPPTPQRGGHAVFGLEADWHPLDPLRAAAVDDADVDGAHIRTLLLTLFHRYMRPMLEAGRVFAAVPPLHRIELTNPRKGQQKYTYTYTDPELRRTLLDLESRNQSWKEPVQRYKGLGEMDANQLAETTMDPRRRMLRRIRIEDAATAADMFSLLMGSEVAPRRDFIIGGAAELDLSRIDT